MTEKRTNLRFPMQRDCRLRVIAPNRRLPETPGKTLNLSSKGMLLSVDRAVPVGSALEVVVHWPVQISEQCRLKMVARARVLRSTESEAAVEIESYEFRTMSPAGFRQH